MAVMPHLAEVAKEAREDRGIRREKIATAADRSADTVRLFEKGGQCESVDRMVDAFAEATGLSPFDLWRRAVERAVEAEAKLKRGIGPTAPASDGELDEEDPRAAEEESEDELPGDDDEDRDEPGEETAEDS